MNIKALAALWRIINGDIAPATLVRPSAYCVADFKRHRYAGGRQCIRCGAERVKR